MAARLEVMQGELEPLNNRRNDEDASEDSDEGMVAEPTRSAHNYRSLLAMGLCIASVSAAVLLAAQRTSSPQRGGLAVNFLGLSARRSHNRRDDRDSRGNRGNRDNRGNFEEAAKEVQCQCPFECYNVVSGTQSSVEFAFDGCISLEDAKVKDSVKVNGNGANLIVAGGTVVENGIHLETGSGNLCVVGGARVKGDITVSGSGSVTFCGEPDMKVKGHDPPSLKVRHSGEVILHGPEGSVGDLSVESGRKKVEVIGALSKTSDVKVRNHKDGQVVIRSAGAGSILHLRDVSIEKLNKTDVKLKNVFLDSRANIAHLSDEGAVHIQDSRCGGDVQIQNVGHVTIAGVDGGLKSFKIDDVDYSATLTGNSNVGVEVGNVKGVLEMSDNVVTNLFVSKSHQVMMTGNKGVSLSCLKDSDKKFDLVDGGCNSFDHTDGKCKKLKAFNYATCPHLAR